MRVYSNTLKAYADKNQLETKKHLSVFQLIGLHERPNACVLRRLVIHCKHEDALLL